MRLAIVLLLIVSFFSACENKSNTYNTYYPIDSLVEAQVQYLSGAQATLLKEATLDAARERKTTLNDTTGWRHELAVFAQLNDINKPSNKGKYRVERDVNDLNSNLLIYSLESTEPRPVMFLKVYYLDHLPNIRKIEGLYREETSLLSSTRQLSMNFQNINNKIVLTSYSVTGGQKMLLADSVQFAVNGMITLP